MNTIKKTNWFMNELEIHKNSISFKQEYLLLNISEQILHIMEQQKISRTDLAQKHGYSDEYLSRLFNGDIDITLDILTQIADVFGYNIDVVFNNIKGAK